MKFKLREKLDLVPAQPPQGLTTGMPFDLRSRNTAGLEQESCECDCPHCMAANMQDDEEIEISPEVLSGLLQLAKGGKIVVIEKKNKKKKRDRCTTIAARKFDPFPSYNAGAAIARCRRGEIWKKKE